MKNQKYSKDFIKEELADLKNDRIRLLNFIEELRRSLDVKNRELCSHLMLISQQNGFFDKLRIDIKRILINADAQTKVQLNKLSAKIKNQKIFAENWESIKFHFENIHPDFFQNLKKDCPALTEKELRQCGYLKMGLSVKETSQLLNVAPKTIEMARYRIKKKFKIAPDVKLSDILREY